MSTDGSPTGRRFGMLRVAGEQALVAVLAAVAPAHPALRQAHLQIFRFDGVEGSTTAQLAAHAGMTKQSMHETVSHLEQHGYLIREPDPDDARGRLVRLTAAGRALERDVHTAIADVLESWRDRLGPERFDLLWSILREMTGDPRPLPDLGEIRPGPPSVVRGPESVVSTDAGLAGPP